MWAIEDSHSNILLSTDYTLKILHSYHAIKGLKPRFNLTKSSSLAYSLKESFTEIENGRSTRRKEGGEGNRLPKVAELSSHTGKVTLWHSNLSLIYPGMSLTIHNNYPKGSLGLRNFS